MKTQLIWSAYIYTGTAPAYFKRITNEDYPNLEDAPKDGWICIVQFTDKRRSSDILNRADIYFIDEEGKWCGSAGRGCEGSTVDQRERMGLKPTVEKNGFWVNDERYFKILKEAYKDPDFPDCRQTI